MKKRYLIFLFIVFCGISVFGNKDKQEEVDFLLFLPNSSNRFVHEEEAFTQLNNLARYLSNKNLSPGQIIVYGYAAYAPNDIESVNLSRERALFVIDELQKRGISKDLFSDPVGLGSVYLWGNNADEDDRKLNRRVRIVLDDETPLLITREIINAETKTANPGIVYKEPAAQEESSFKFPWWILPLLAIFIAFLIKKSAQKPVHKDKTVNTQPQIPQTDTAPLSAAAMATCKVNLDEEIRLRAYELSQQRNEQGDYRDQDWHNAVREISAWYTACGHSVFIEDGSWWASRSYSY